MAVTIIPNVTNWSVTPQNGQAGYFLFMNTWLSESTAVIASLQTAITAQNTANSEINALAIQTENNANIAASVGNYQGVWSNLVTYSKSMGVSVGNLYYISKVDSNLNHAVTDTNYWLCNPINDKMALTGNQTVAGVKTFSSSPIVPTPTTDFQSVPLRSTNITVNVGSGQTYTTINQALEYLSGFYPMYKKSGITATINLKAGFVMAEQVLVSGIDLGWITIVGEDAETIITHTALTTVLGGAYPAFGVDKGGTSPVIGQLFRFNVEKVGGNKHGLMTFGAGSSAYVLPGKGFIGAGANGIFAAYASTINAFNANCSNAGVNGIFADAASTINANEANCSNAGVNGIFSLRSSIINASAANCSNAGANGIFADQGSVLNALNAIIQNQTKGTARIRVQSGSTAVVTGINTTGGTVTVFSQAVNTLTANGIIYQ